MPMRARGEYIGCRHDHVISLGLRSAQVVRCAPPGGPGGSLESVLRLGPAWPRACGGARAARAQKYFLGGVREYASARGENIFLSFQSCVLADGHTEDGGGRCFRLLDRRESSISASFS